MKESLGIVHLFGELLFVIIKDPHFGEYVFLEKIDRFAEALILFIYLDDLFNVEHKESVYKLLRTFYVFIEQSLSRSHIGLQLLLRTFYYVVQGTEALLNLLNEFLLSLKELPFIPSQFLLEVTDLHIQPLFALEVRTQPSLNFLFDSVFHLFDQLLEILALSEKFFRFESELKG
jgi:hypothetical protein